MSSKIISTDNLALFTENFGNPADPPVLLIMGAMASGVWWPEELCEMQPQLPLLHAGEDRFAATEVPDRNACFPRTCASVDFGSLEYKRIRLRPEN